MTNPEFSSEFDVLYDSIASDQAPGFNAYEKSVLLTEAQEELVVELYSGMNIAGSFEENEELRRGLRNLIKSCSPSKAKDVVKLYASSQAFTLPPDVLFITYESVVFADLNVKCLSENTEVVPVTQDELHRVMKNPFRMANEKRVLRVDKGADTVELISKYTIGSYNIMYLKRPSPIILEDLSDMSINNLKKSNECELDPILHRPILERAVKRAIASMGIGQSK